jgi:predicted metal-dependent enzyme (double-stranded beta helix superfamily)
MQRFDKDAFIEDCLTAIRTGDRPQSEVRELVDRAVSRPADIQAEVRPHTESPMMTIWHRSEELTALHIVWPPDVDLFAHDHNMWAVIGIYGGQEDNRFYRKLDDGRIEPHTGKSLYERDVVSLGPDVVHSVSNPGRQWTAALHVYGGEFFTTPRTMWDKENFNPLPLDVEFIKQNLEAAAARARLADVPGERP